MFNRALIRAFNTEKIIAGSFYARIKQANRVRSPDHMRIGIRAKFADFPPLGLFDLDYFCCGLLGGT
jgi:hypothetical protein